MNQPKFSVLTPTFKGKKRLIELKNYLEKQTFKDFEWIIVQDGNDEETRSIAKSLIENTSFKTSYYEIPHNHKKAALNKGISHAAGVLLLIADDDDGIKENALEILNDKWESLENKNEFVGVTGLCEYEDGTLVGKKFPNDEFVSTSQECNHKYKCNGEKWGFQRLDIMKQYPFFEDAEGYVGESTVWLAIGKKYKTLYVNEVLRIYNQTEDSIIREELTKEKIKRNCQAYTYGYRFNALNLGIYRLYNPKYFLALCIFHMRYLLHSVRFKKTKAWMFSFHIKTLLVLIIGLPGVFFFLNDLAKNR